MGVFLSRSPPQFSRQGVPLKLKFTYLAAVVDSEPGTHPSTVFPALRLEVFPGFNVGAKEPNTSLPTSVARP